MTWSETASQNIVTTSQTPMAESVAAVCLA